MCEKLGDPDAFMGVKGQEFPAYDPRAFQGMGVAFATCNRGACYLRAWTLDFETSGNRNPHTPVGKSEWVVHEQNRTTAHDKPVACRAPPTITSRCRSPRVLDVCSHKHPVSTSQCAAARGGAGERGLSRSAGGERVGPVAPGSAPPLTAERFVALTQGRPRQGPVSLRQRRPARPGAPIESDVRRPREAARPETLRRRPPSDPARAAKW